MSEANARSAGAPARMAKGARASSAVAKRRQPAGKRGGKHPAAPRRRREATRLSMLMDAKTRLRLFLEASALDFALVLVVSVALIFTVSYGFYSAGAWRGNVFLIGALAIPLLAALFAGSWSKKALAPSIVATVVVAVIIVGASVALSTEPLFVSADSWDATGVVNDVEGNYAIFALIVVVVPMAVYLLSRRPVGLVFLLIASVLACGTIQFLYREWIVDQPGLAASAVVLVGVAMMFVYQTYKQSVYAAKRVKRTSFSGAFAFSALVAAVSILIGVGLFYGIVDGMGLQTMEIKPFEHTVARPVDENAGTLDTMQIEGDQTTSETDDTQEPTQQNTPQSLGASIVQAAGTFLQNTSVGQSIQDMLRYGSGDQGQDLESISYLFLQLTGVILAILLVQQVSLAIVIWHRHRERRLKKAAVRGGAYEVWFLYNFLMGRLARLKIRKPAYLTQLEFAAGFDSALAPFSRNTGGVTFLEVTGLYMDVCYGNLPVERQDLERVEAFYWAFFKNAREYVGWPKWILWKYWRI